MIGYFFFGSKSNGFHMLPYRSVTPSPALTTNVSAGRQPYSLSRDRSAFSSSITMLPRSSRKMLSGPLSTREILSTRNFRDGDSIDEPAPGPAPKPPRPPMPPNPA